MKCCNRFLKPYTVTNTNNLIKLYLYQMYSYYLCPCRPRNLCLLTVQTVRIVLSMLLFFICTSSYFHDLKITWSDIKNTKQWLCPSIPSLDCLHIAADSLGLSICLITLTHFTGKSRMVLWDVSTRYRFEVFKFEVQCVCCCLFPCKCFICYLKQKLH